MTTKKLLNVGGQTKSLPIPELFSGWQHDLLDIDPRGNPDILCDARELGRLPPGTYDAVLCAHNLEHYFQHDVLRVLAGFWHVLKPDGFALVIAPDMVAVMQAVVAKQLDIEDVLYQCEAGPITVRDVIYGYGPEIERSGCDFFAHKTGFSKNSLVRMLEAARFSEVVGKTENFNAVAVAFKQPANDQQRSLFGLPPQAGGRHSV